MDLVKQCAQTVLRVAKQILTDLTPGTADPDPDELAELAELAEAGEPAAGLELVVA